MEKYRDARAALLCLHPEEDWSRFLELKDSDIILHEEIYNNGKSLVRLATKDLSMGSTSAQPVLSRMQL